ncbi:hypothetical protein KC320_g4780 [Hortaea werneckii]|nr:hypothetical protein KC320_g4780 [Hortaea werneckii]
MDDSQASGSVYEPSQDTTALMQSTPVKGHEARQKKRVRSLPRTAPEDIGDYGATENDGTEDHVDLENYSNPFQLAEESLNDIDLQYAGETQADEIRVASVLPSSAPSLNAPGMPPQRLTELDPTGLQDRDQQAAVLREALHRGVRPFVEVAYMATISVHREILDGVMDGSLVSRCADPSTAEATIVAKFKERTDAVNHPGTNQQGTATFGGLSPTTSEHKKAVKDFHNSCFGKIHQDRVLAHAIDSIMEPHTSLADIRKGVRKYLRNNENLPIERPKQAASSFCNVFTAAV